MTRPATCRPAITPYIAISLARSSAVIAATDCRSARPMRGDLDALAVAPRAGLSGRALISLACLYRIPCPGSTVACGGGHSHPYAPGPHAPVCGVGPGAHRYLCPAGYVPGSRPGGTRVRR